MPDHVFTHQCSLVLSHELAIVRFENQQELTKRNHNCRMSLEKNFVDFVTLHRPQLLSSGVPEHFWETLYVKLSDSVFDAGNSFSIAQLEDYEEENYFTSFRVIVTASEGIKASDPKQIYLIDHAWTFRPDQIRIHLKDVDGLLERMSILMGVQYNKDDLDGTVERVMKTTWKYCQTYSIGNQSFDAENRVPIWYVMDEFGSRIQHSNQPSVRVVPFFSMIEQATYSLMFPIVDLEEDDYINRDFLEGFDAYDEVSRSALLIPWSSQFFEKYSESTDVQQTEPSPDYFSVNRMMETLPTVDINVPALPDDRPIKTYVEYTFIRDFLKHERFQLVDDQEEAEILWLSTHFKDFKDLSENFPSKRINQFPREHILTVKDLLCIVARRSNKDSKITKESLRPEPHWLPVTYNLKTELPAFVAFYEAQKKLGRKNYWIIKPWNLARSLDTHITEDLDMILRLATSGPKICQKYIDSPVLFYRNDIKAKVKFDVRYILLLSSTYPLKAYVYKRFWLRFANKPFELNRFDEYERHFTVMNYSSTQLHQMFCNEFIEHFESQNPGQVWSKTEEKIFAMLLSLLKAATNGEKSYSLVSSPQSRAMYAVDLMLSWEDDGLNEAPEPSIQPKLLEVNWAPDCKRACNYYPEFFDDVFSVLFLDETEGRHVHLLS